MPSSAAPTLRRKAEASSAAKRPAKRSKVASPLPLEASDAESGGSPSTEAESAAGSDDGDGSDVDDESDDEAASKAAMLRALEAHGMSMFGAVLPSAAGPRQAAKGKGRAAPIDLGLELSDEDDDDGEDGDESFDEDDSEGGMEDDEARFSGGEDDDMEDKLSSPVASSSAVPAARKPVEITFDPSQYKGGSKATKAEYKAFMVR
jgi:hypothetical protein